MNILLVLIVLVAVFLIITIMVQNPKGGGLDSSFAGGGSQMIGGVKQTGDFLEKSTWFLSALLVILVLGVNVMKSGDNKDAVLKGAKVEIETPKADTTPAAPTNDATKTQETDKK